MPSRLARHSAAQPLMTSAIIMSCGSTIRKLAVDLGVIIGRSGGTALAVFAGDGVDRQRAPHRRSSPLEAGRRVRSRRRLRSFHAVCCCWLDRLNCRCFRRRRRKQRRRSRNDGERGAGSNTAAANVIVVEISLTISSLRMMPRWKKRAARTAVSLHRFHVAGGIAGNPDPLRMPAAILIAIFPKTGYTIL